MSSPRLLVVDDDPDLVDFVSKALEPLQLTIDSAGSGEAALLRVREQSPELMLLDLVLPGIDGLETLRRLRREGFGFPVVLITSHGAIGSTIEAMEQGAWDYLAKPLHVAELEALVERCLRYLRHPDGLDEPAGESGIVLLGGSAPMVELFKAIGRVAKQDSPVLLVGERGSGKRLVARAIHGYSGRSGPLLALDCMAIPETLLERAVFGGEDPQEVGLLERARHGSLLLARAEELPRVLQNRLLTVLEERLIRRPGSREPVPLETRIIATLREPGAEGTAGELHEDLWERLAEHHIRIPPLRERGEDLRLLCDECVRRLAPRSGRKVESIESLCYERLQQHSWPGNVSELWGALAEALTRGTGPVLLAAELPELEPVPPPAAPDDVADSLVRLERIQISKVLDETGWNQSAAAKRLGIHRNTLRRKIRQYQLEPPGDGAATPPAESVRLSEEIH
jgi:two-component system response regulator AtoC